MQNFVYNYNHWKSNLNKEQRGTYILVLLETKVNKHEDSSPHIPLLSITMLFLILQKRNQKTTIP